MPDYSLYYWPIPFRGQFVRATLAYAGATWDDRGVDETAEVKNRPVAEQPVPHMAPPLLVDHAAGVAIAQMPAILWYLGLKHRLLPGNPLLAALAQKIIADTNDVLDEVTRNGGQRMWNEADWDGYRPRLRRWMEIFEETGRRHGLTPDSGHILGSKNPGLADLVAATLWFTMTEKLPKLRPMLDAAAPAIAGLSDRVAALPPIATMRSETDAAYGATWCGGQIETSLREVLS